MDEIRKINTNFYNRNAVKWAAVKTNPFYHEEGFRKFLHYLKDGDSIIDIGCAYGIHVPLFLGIGRNLKYEGFDISEKMIQLAQSRYPQLNFFIADILDKTTFPSKQYEGFWAGAILMHIPESQWDDMWNNICSLVKKNGIGYFTLPINRPNEESELDRRHFTIFNQQKLLDFLKKNHLELLEQGNFPLDTRSIWNWYLIRVL